MKKLLLAVFSLSLFLAVGCSDGDDMQDDMQLVQEQELSLLEIFQSNETLSAKRPRPTIWADCKKYSGVVVPATFKPESDPFDELYMIPSGAKDGVNLISDSKPGDQDYNGGRWHLNVLKSSVDPTKYADACMEEDLDPADFDSTDMYFGCPMTRLKQPKD